MDKVDCDFPATLVPFANQRRVKVICGGRACVTTVFPKSMSEVGCCHYIPLASCTGD